MALVRKLAVMVRGFGVVLLLCVGALALVSSGAQAEPGPVSVKIDADFWGAEKSVVANVILDRDNKKPLVLTQARVYYDRHPPNRGLYTNEEVRLHNGFVYVLNPHEIRRSDARPLFAALDKVCPALNDAC